LIADLPVAGFTGTLKASTHRFTSAPTRCAAGKIEAKTGTLDDASALAGYATMSTGENAIFVFISNGKASHPAQLQIDRLATTVTGCW
jgi:D-alanyl-D-alanine carboxypeptidase/D-alanyl-D-alanine-endopeptidase (penicillin-binding protein 4)